MNWAEIKKKIFAYFSDEWTTTPILWPFQSVRPVGSDWIEIHMMAENEMFRRKTEKERGTILFQIGIFSRSENQYSLDTVSSTLSDFLGQKDLVSSNYQIRLENLGAVDVPWSGENTEKIIRHRAVTVNANIFEI